MSVRYKHVINCENIATIYFRYPATRPQTQHSYTDTDIPILGEFYGDKDVTLVLPGDLTVRDVKWVSCWCREGGRNAAQISSHIHISSFIPLPFYIT
jgi:hypothetical protein